MMMHPRSKILTLLSAALLAVALAASATAEVWVEVLPATAPVAADRAATPKVAASPSVVLPYFRTAVNDSQGETTFFAVRNNHTSAVQVRVTYFGPSGTPARTSDVQIAANGVFTRDLRAVEGLPATDGIATGAVVIEALGDGLPTGTLSGDYFRVNPDGAAANGGALLPLSDTDCNRWTHRILDGGPFEGGTRLSFLALDAPTEGATLSGNVFNEAGQLVSVVAVTSDEIAFELTGEELMLPTDFGSIDWVFSGDGHGTVAVTYSALGQYSVGAEAACVDVVEEEPDTEPEPDPGTVVFELPGTFLDCRGCGNWQYDMPLGETRFFRRVILDFDLYVDQWDPSLPNGFHCIFWLNNGTRWQDMMGYLNSRGTQNRTVFQSNGPLGNPIGVERYASPGVLQGGNYKVHYEYDTIEKIVWYRITDSDGNTRVADVIQLPSNVGPLRTNYTFIQFGSQPNGVVESLTERWRWSNFKAQFIE